MKNILIIIILLLLVSCFLPQVSAEEPIQLDAKQEDISLTDNIAIAKAQVERYPDNPEAHFNLAIALSRTSLVEEAIKELSRTKKLIRKPENKDLIDKKITEFQDFLKNDPNATNVRYRLAFAYYLKSYFLVKEQKKAEKKDKDNQASVFDSDKLYIETKDPAIKKNLELSIQNFKELLETNPRDIWAKVYLAFILAEQFNDIEQAKRLWHEALKQDPKNPAPHFFIGELHIKEGNLKEGFIELAQALLLRSQGY